MKKLLDRYVQEARWDRLLKIRTSGRDDSRSDDLRYAYEPTEYSVLERLASSGYIRRGNTLVDYGCGKGRVSFFLAYQTRCRCIGIDFSPPMLERALKNRRTAVSGERTDFYRQDAAEYPVPAEADRFYFFNPFAVKILRQVLDRIRKSRKEAPREALLFFYYPSDEYIACLMTVEELIFLDEIDCRDLFEPLNDRERILVFRFGPDPAGSHGESPGLSGI